MNSPAPRLVRLTVLSDMAGPELGAMLDQSARWGLDCLDLKGVFGKNIADLSLAEAHVLSAALSERRIEPQAFSTHLFKLSVEEGEDAFAAHLRSLDHVLALARIIRPRMIRLIIAETRRRDHLPDAVAYLRAEQPWVFSMYREAIDRIHDAGFETVIENETGGCVFSNGAEIAAFFNELRRDNKVRYTWDVQNLWQMGTFPSLNVYHQVRPWLGYLHLKGGRVADDATPPAPLRWRAPLVTASWPVLDIVRAVVADGLSPVICLNPSHGQLAPGEPREAYTERDIAFLRQHLPVHP